MIQNQEFPEKEVGVETSEALSNTENYLTKKTEQMPESKKHPVSLLLIQNTEKRLEKLRPTFEHLVKGGYGKLTSGHFTIDTRFTYLQPATIEQQVFNMLQIESQALGYAINCYCFNL